MENPQSDFLIKWAKVCMLNKDPKIPCIVTWWDCGTVNEKLNIAIQGRAITIYGTDIKTWLDFFNELRNANMIKLINCGGSGIVEYPRYDFDYEFVSEKVINEYLK